MKLKSGCIFWPQVSRDPQITAPILDRDIQCDVAVIGAGISGALAAYHLTKAGIHVVMVDREQVAEESTSASTGLLQYEIDTPLTKLALKLGESHATAAYRASIEAVRAFEPLVQDVDDPSLLAARHSLYLASQEKDVELLRAEAHARQSMNIGVHFLSREALQSDFHISRPAALWSSTAFDVDPYRLTRQLVRKSLQQGLELFCQTEVTRFEPTSQHAILHTRNGPRISATKIIFAMGYRTMGLLPHDLCELNSTFALATDPIENFANWPERSLIWESARPYLYLRTTQDNRAIIGGEDDDSVDPEQRDQLIEAKSHTLMRKFKNLFPSIQAESSCAWAGTFAQTTDGLPYIGALNKFPSCYFALGYGGNGITFSLIAARIITDLFLNRPNDHSRLFRFDR